MNTKAIFLCITVLVLIPLITVSERRSFAASPGYNFSCVDNYQIRVAVERLGYRADNRDRREDFELFEKDPAAAACHLIKELRVVPQAEVTPWDAEKHRPAMHVIWSIRALRYITGGLDFKGRTKYKFKKSEKERRYFLTVKGQEELPFFAVWMSRDTVYIAPSDAQSEIIERWIRWYSETGQTFDYKSSKSIDQWYF